MALQGLSMLSGNRRACPSNKIGTPSRGILPNLFTYARYNTELTPSGLAAIALPKIDPKHVQKLDSVEHIAELQQVGKAVASQINAKRFEGFL